MIALIHLIYQQKFKLVLKITRIMEVIIITILALLDPGCVVGTLVSVSTVHLKLLEIAKQVKRSLFFGEQTVV